ncbi:MAG: hypothetical protein J6331_04600, partial [Lentisphaeria bacterium]|nr:hypothetical protein [Lentisphaeria bacterium]
MPEQGRSRVRDALLFFFPPGGMFRKHLLPALLLFLLLSGGEILSAPARLRIIQTTDIHGECSSYSRPGVMELAALIREARKEAGEDHTLYIDCD